MSVAPLKAQPDLPLTQALDDLPCNVFYADLDLNLVYHNKKAAETLNQVKDAFKAEYNIDVSKILGTSIANFHPEPGRLPALLKDDRNYPITTDVKVDNILMELQVNYVKNESNETIGYVVYWDDITEKKEAQEMAFRLSQMVEQAPINMMTADPNGVLRYLNTNSIKTLREFEHLLPEKVEGLIDQSIDWFHKNPAHPKKIFSDPSNLPHKAVIQFSEEKLDLLVSALYDRDNNYIGPMVTWEKVTEKVKLADSLKHAASQVSTAAEELLSVSESMSANAEETSAQANTASSASEEVSAGIQTVATNMEEMTASIREITKNTNEASLKSADATNLSNEANVIIDKLGESSLAIGNIIKVITSIAQQTNLLALNATIEAARAGEAGKGFAVVANEVKELAKQTATATEDISKKIETIQSDSQVAVTSIGQVTEAINQLNAIATNIASSMEEQSATTNEVARVVSESTVGVSQITENIQQVSSAAEQTGKATGDMRGAANNLSKLAVELNDMVKKVIDA